MKIQNARDAYTKMHYAAINNVLTVMQLASAYASRQMRFGTHGDTILKVNMLNTNCLR